MRAIAEMGRAYTAHRRHATLVAYLPGLVAVVPVLIAVLLRRPFAVVVVGDPAEALRPDVVPGIGGAVGRRVLPAVQRWACRRADVIRYVTKEALQASYPPGPHARVTALTDAVVDEPDAPRTHPAERRPLRLVTVASLDRPYKGIGDLLTALGACEPGRFVLRIVGEGALREQYESQARGLANVPVTFTGHLTRHEVLDELRSADAFVLSSWTEGQPRALYEAMAAGLPVIATAVGGIVDAIDRDALIPPRRPEALTAALTRLHDDRQWFDQLAASSVERAAAVHAETSGPRHQCFVRELTDLARKPGDGPTAVVHVFGAMDVGGAERRTVEIMQSLAGEYCFHFVTLSGRRGSLADDIEAMGGVVHPMRLSPSFPLQYVRLLRALRPVAVDSHVATFSGALTLLARVAGVPTRIARFHSTGDDHGDSTRRRAQRWLMRQLIAWSATDVPGVSPAALADGYRRDWELDPRCALAPNGIDDDALWAQPLVDLRAELGLPSSAILCLHVGRASPEKNRQRVPGIVHALRERGYDAWGVLVGPSDPADAEQVMAAAEGHGISDRIVILDTRSDVGAVMRSADLLVLTSLREGLPGVVLESLAVGTPVLSSEVPGAVWLGETFQHIRCLPLSESDDAWAQAAVQLLDAPHQHRNPADVRADFAASPFGLQRSADRHRALYGRSRGQS
ncbi:glycosyltransferase [Blastococcus sp. SYSU D01042]